MGAIVAAANVMKPFIDPMNFPSPDLRLALSGYSPSPDKPQCTSPPDKPALTPAPRR